MLSFSSTVIIVTLLCVLLGPTKMLAQQEFSLVIIATSSQDINLLRLECRNMRTQLGVPDAFFWLNGTSLFDIMPPVTINRPSGGAEIIFQITRSLEGMYTCGTQTNPNNRVESEPQNFVAFPTFVDLSNVQTVFPVGSGTEAQLKCAIQPGRLIGFYSVEWSNASIPNEVLIGLSGGNTFGGSTNNRYSIDTEDLSLIISDVSPADAGDYICILSVDGGHRATNIMTYEQTRSINLNLVVFDLPRIPHPPTPQVVELQTNNVRNSSLESATFSCTATASQQFASSLEVFWWHDDMRDVRSINPDKYSVEEVGRTITNGVTSVVTELTITSVGVTDSGMVRCEARIPPSEASGSVPATTFADTTLTVLGGFVKMCVSITTNGNIFFDITLPDIIAIDFNLFIEYLPLNNPTLVIPRTTDEGFSNTSSVLYLERAPPLDILNTEFTLHVALTTLNLETGPRSNRSSTLDTRNRPLGEEKLTEILIAVSVVLVVILISILIVVIVVVVFCRNHFKKKVANEIALQGAVAVQGYEMREQPGRRPVDVLAESFVTLYTRIRAECDSAAVGNDDQQESLIQPQLTNDEIEQTIKFIEHVVEPALRNAQLKRRVFELLHEIFYRLMSNPDQQDHLPQFLIEAFKMVYFSLYNDINQDEHQTEDLAAVAKFVEETSNLLIKKGYQIRYTRDSFIQIYKS